jgi:hypothetical protein
MKRIIFHTFTMGDVEDPEIYIAQPIYEFQQTPKGQWMMENGQDLQYRIAMDYEQYGYKVVLYGELNDRLATEYYLRWS